DEHQIRRPRRAPAVPVVPGDPPDAPAAGGDAPWPVQRMRAGRTPASRGWTSAAPRRPVRNPRRPVVALPVTVVLALLAAFFGWVSAEPLWLAVGHGDRGTATITRCTGSGVGQRCVGAFRPATGDAEPRRVALLGLTPAQRAAGGDVPAQMVGAGSRQAYVGSDRPALHLRWGLGLLLVLLCGAGICWATGATRFARPRERRLAVLGSLLGPVLLASGFVVAAW
ncbi:MAG TPA: hypothetical protein VNV66_05265, partial [Pilimelia sp.]|nr:hypothetical protein [Pilimelia sp.]